MKKAAKVILALIAVCFAFLSQSTFILAEEIVIYLDFENQIITAKLEEAPLRSVFERIKREKHLWIKGSRFLLDEKVSVQFKDLSIEDGLQRILRNMNHCLIFDQHSNLLGVIVVGRKPIRPSRRRLTVPPKRTPRKRMPRRTSKRRLRRE